MPKTKQKPPKNIHELRLRMAEVFAGIQNDEVDLPTANALTKAASAIINACKVEVINNQIMRNVRTIDFLLTEKEMDEKRMIEHN